MINIDFLKDFINNNGMKKINEILLSYDNDTDKINEIYKLMSDIFSFDLNNFEIEDLNDIDLICPIFNNIKNVEQSSYLNWRMDTNTLEDEDFYNMAEGFLQCANCLTKICLQNNADKKADIWIFPILFNIYHSMELFLKAILFLLIKDIPKIHNLNNLLNKVLNNDFIKENNEKIQKEINFISDIINDLFKGKDDFYFRYPYMKKKWKIC